MLKKSRLNFNNFEVNILQEFFFCGTLKTFYCVETFNFITKKKQLKLTFFFQTSGKETHVRKIMFELNEQRYYVKNNLLHYRIKNIFYIKNK